MGRSCTDAMGSGNTDTERLSLDCKCCNGEAGEHQLRAEPTPAQWPQGSGDDSLPSATAYLLNTGHMPGAAGCASLAAGVEQIKAALLKVQQRASSGSNSEQTVVPTMPLIQQTSSIAAPLQQVAVHLQAARAKRPRPVLASPKLSHAAPSLPSLSAARGSAVCTTSTAADAAAAATDAEVGRVQPVTPSFVPRLMQHQQQLSSTKQLQAAQQQQSQTASPNVQKQRTACLAAMLSPAPRSLTPIYCPSAAALLLGVRLCITTTQGTRSGKVVDMQATAGKHRVQFDDGSSDWLTLNTCSWRWLSPRTPSAGLTPSLRNAMRKMGASNLVHDPNKPMPLPTQGPPIPVLGTTPTDAAAAVGHRVWLWSPGDVRWHLALVVALSGAGSGRHHVVYMDGSDEWVEVNKEVVAWEPRGHHGHASSRAHHRHALGLPLGVAAPTGQAAVGWRLAVYWTQDQTFYEGRVTAYKPSSGQHEVVYDDDEKEMMRLDEEIVVWRCKAANMPAKRAITAGSKQPAAKRARANHAADAGVDAALLRRTVSASGSPSETSEPPAAARGAAEAAAAAAGVDKSQACKATAGQVQHNVNMMQQVV